MDPAPSKGAGKDDPGPARKPSLKKSASVQSKMIIDDKDPKKLIHLNRVQIGERIYVADGIKEYYAATVDGFSCAMKEIPCNPTDISRADIQKEIIYLENLPSHPNVIKYLFHTQTSSCFRLFVQRYPQNLRQYLVERISSNPPKPLSPLEIMNLLLDICKGLEFLHSHKILHRNLRTDHVFAVLDERRAVKSLALGELEASKLALRSSPKTVVGTPAYMSPEVLSAPTTGAYSLRADVWSLGMVLYELLTFQRPYHSVPYMLIPSHILSGRRPDLPSLMPSYDFLKEIFMQCTQLDADARPSVERLVSSLVTAVAGDDLLRAQPSVPAPPPSAAAAKGATLAAPPAPFVEVNGYALQQKALFDAITAAHAKMKQMDVPVSAQLLAEAAARTASVMGAIEEVCWTDKGTLTVKKLASLDMPHPLNTDAAKIRLAQLQSVHATTPVMFNDPTPHAPLASMLLVPLLTPEGRTLGTLTLANRTEGAYGSADLVSVEAIRKSLVTLLADHRSSQFAQHLQKDLPLFEALFQRLGTSETVRIGNVAPDATSVVLEAELRRFVSEAKEALQLKLRFLRNLNLELKLPLHGIVGVANLLSTGGRLGVEDTQYVKTVVESAQLLLGLLEGLSDAASFAPQLVPPQQPHQPNTTIAVSVTNAATNNAAAAVAANPIQVSPSARLGLNLCELLEDIGAAFSYSAEAKGLELLVDVDTRLPTHVVLDASKLRQLLFYALCHAVRSLKVGLVTLSASSKSGAKKPDVLIEISVLAQSTTDEKLEATEAVGMHLARSIASSLNASLDENVSTSSLSHVLTLPAVMDVDQSRTFALSLKQLSERLANLSIVVVIPNDYVLNVLRRYAYGMGLKKVTYASSVSEVSTVRGSVDVAIVDHDLLEDGGYAVAESAHYAVLCKPLIMPTPLHPPFSASLNRPVRRAEFFALLTAAFAALSARPKHEPTVPSEAPIASAPVAPTSTADVPSLAPFATTSRLSNGSSSASSSLTSVPIGFSAPSSPNPLSNSGSLIPPSPGTRPITPPASPPVLRSPGDTRKILVVDDNPANLKIATAMLQAMGWDTDAAENGVQGVELATKYTYAMILMDVMMPECDGLEATRRIRAMEKALNRKPVPIVAHTAAVVESMPKEQASLTEAGMDDLVPKPLRRERLREVVARYCRRISETHQ